MPDDALTVNIEHLSTTLRSALLGKPMRRGRDERMLFPWNGWHALCVLRYQLGRADAPIDPDAFADHVVRRRHESAVEARLWRWIPSAPLISILTRGLCETTTDHAPAPLLARLAALISLAGKTDPERRPALLNQLGRRFSDWELCAPAAVEPQRIVANAHRMWLAMFVSMGRVEAVRALPSAFDGPELTQLCEAAVEASGNPAAVMEIADALDGKPNAPVSALVQKVLPILDPSTLGGHVVFDCIGPYLLDRGVDVDVVLAKLRELATVDKLDDGSEPPALITTAVCALKNAPDLVLPLLRRGLRSRDEQLQGGFAEIAALVANDYPWLQLQDEIDAVMREQPDRAAVIRVAIERARPSGGG